MQTKDFIYYDSAAVLLAVTTQVAQADEMATQTPSGTEGNHCQPAATSKVEKASSPAVSTVSCFTEFRGCNGINFSNIFSC